ncbi:MAG: hypothetical protein ACYCU7_10615 [Acidimicrobiales bacterium]
MARRRMWLYGGLASVVGVAVPVTMGTGGVAQAASAPVVAVPSAGGVVMAPAATSGGAASTTTVRSVNSAGYLSSPSGGIAAFGATVIVPTVTCAAGETTSNDASVQVDATQSSGGFGIGSSVTLSCNNGTASYGAGLFVTGKGKPLAGPVLPGDKLVTTVHLTTVSGTTTATARIVDLTTKDAVNIKATTTGILSSYGWDIFQGTQGQPVVNFGTLLWRNAKVNGATLGSTSPQRFVLVSATGKTGHVLVSTSLINSTGKGFTNKFVAAS